MTREQQNQKDYEDYVDRAMRNEKNKTREQFEAEYITKDVKAYYHEQPLRKENINKPAPVLREPV